MGVIKKIHENLVLKKYSAVELVGEYLKKIEEINPNTNAYITVTRKKALGMAEKTDRKIAAGESITMLEGIPYALKDNIVTKDILTTCGSKILKNFVPVYDAKVYELLYENGGVLLGKTNMDEFGMGSSSENSYFGAVRNPKDRNFSVGGSSGGSAAAVMADMAVFAIGSDTGGSVRQPAACCNLFGIKPTYGVISRYGLVAYASSMDHIGIIAKDEEDAEIVFDAVAKKDIRDSTSVEFRKEEADGKIKIAVVNGTDMHDVKLPGCEFTGIEIKNLRYVSKTYYIIACAEAASNLARYDGIRYGYRTKIFSDREEMIFRTRSEGFSEEVKKRIILGNFILSSDSEKNIYKNAVRNRTEINSELEKLLSMHDVIMCPVVKKQNIMFDEKHTEMDFENECYAQLANLAGLPAVSVPLGKNESGGTKSIQLIGRRFSEKLLFKLAGEIRKNSTEEAGADV